MFRPVSHVLNHLIFVQPRLVPCEGVFLDQFLDSIAEQRREYGKENSVRNSLLKA